MNSLIDLRQVYKIYNHGMESEVRALDGVTLQIRRGEYVAVVGTSGSGKSTLMNILGCLDAPSFGEYRLGGIPVSQMRDSQLAEIRNREIGFIFQGFNLLGGMTAMENVELPLIYQGVSLRERKDRAYLALARVGLESRMDHRPGQMSGGQQQRVAIARALVTEPSIIMADEPTGNLDSRTGEHVIKILDELNRTGSTIVLITHDNTIAALARRAIRIIDGRIVDDRVNVPAGGIVS